MKTEVQSKLKFYPSNAVCRSGSRGLSFSDGGRWKLRVLTTALYNVADVGFGHSRPCHNRWLFVALSLTICVSPRHPLSFPNSRIMSSVV